MLATVAGLAFSKRSRSACLAFGWHSWTASIRAARTKPPRTPVASHAVSRSKLLITSPVNGHFLVCLNLLTKECSFQHSNNTLKKWVGAIRQPLVTQLLNSERLRAGFDNRAKSPRHVKLLYVFPPRIDSAACPSNRRIRTRPTWRNSPKRNGFSIENI